MTQSTNTVNITRPFVEVDLHKQTVQQINGILSFSEVVSRPKVNNSPVNPQDFILEKEADGSIIEYDIAVLTQIALFYRNNSDSNDVVSVNISGLTINKSWQHVVNVLNGIEHLVIIEITETYPVELAQAKKFANAYQQEGGKISLDDINSFELDNTELLKDKIELIHITKPDIIKIVKPLTIHDMAFMYYLIMEALNNNKNLVCVVERVDNALELEKFQFKLSALLNTQPLFQGYLFDKGTPFLYDIL